MTDRGSASGNADDASFEYAAGLYDNIVGWYRIAETKAQIILTLNGVFTSFIVTSLLVKKSDARMVVNSFGHETWLFLALMGATLSLSILCALLCLVTRIMPRSEIKARYGDLQAAGESRPAEVFWFFQTVAGLGKVDYEHQTTAFSRERLREAFIGQNHVLSGKVVRKHIWVNWAFGFAAATLLLFIALATSYLVRIA